jgi:hypothetical protein
MGDGSWFVAVVDGRDQRKKKCTCGRDGAHVVADFFADGRLAGGRETIGKDAIVSVAVRGGGGGRRRRSRTRSAATTDISPATRVGRPRCL